MVNPLWIEQLPAFNGAGAGFICASSGYTSKIPFIFLPIPMFVKSVFLNDPGTKYKQPFSKVASSNAIQMDSASRSENDQKGVSKCHAVGLAKGRLNKA